MSTTAATVTEVPVAAIVAGDNDRKRFDEDALDRLAATIADHGLLQPITVRPVDGGFEIVAGERRFRAVSRLGWANIPAIVRNLDDDAAGTAMLVENTGRVDLDPVEEGLAFAKRISTGATVDEVARLAGVTAWKVNLRVSLLNLVDEAQALVRRGDLPLMMASKMVGLDANRQRIALRALTSRDLSQHAFGALADKLLDDQRAEGMETLDFELAIEEAAEQTARERNRATRGELVAVISRLAAELPEGSPARDEALAVLRNA